MLKKNIDLRLIEFNHWFDILDSIIQYFCLIFWNFILRLGNMYQSRAHSNTNEVLPEQTYYYVIYSSSFLENTSGILPENKLVTCFY